MAPEPRLIGAPVLSAGFSLPRPGTVTSRGRGFGLFALALEDKPDGRAVHCCCRRGGWPNPLVPRHLAQQELEP